MNTNTTIKKEPTKAELKKRISELNKENAYFRKQYVIEKRRANKRHKFQTYLEDLCTDLKERIDFLEDVSGEDRVHFRTTFPDDFS